MKASINDEFLQIAYMGLFIFAKSNALNQGSPLKFEEDEL